VIRVVAVICVGSGLLVLHPVVLGSHRDGLHIHTVLEVLHPPLGRRYSFVVLIFCPDRRAVAARLRDDLLNVLRASARRIESDVDDVVLPVQPNLGDVWLLS
jgi:hypothetical protein